jgi:hypothetical protein
MRTWCSEALGIGRPPSPRQWWLTLAGVFLLALAVRSLHAVDLADVMYTHRQPGTRMAWRYDDTAQAIRAGEGILWPRDPDPARTGVMSRPPGYGLYLVAVYGTLGRSFFAAQLVQNVLTSAACVVLVLLTSRLVSFRVGALSGILAAVLPHLAYTSSFVLPDSLSALTLLLGMWALSVAHPDGRRSWWWSALAGAIFGATAWLRPNALLLPPFVAVVLLVVWRNRRRAVGHALAVLATAALVISPITIRNYLLTGEVIPISINGGLTLWHGVTDVAGFSAGARRRDQLVMDEEATRYGNPRYREWWAEPDGVLRDRDRFRRSLLVIRDNPGLFARVMLRRMGQMLNFAGGGPAVVEPWTAAPAPDALTRLPTDDADGDGEPTRSHDLARTPRDARFLVPGRGAAFLRPVVRPLQQVLVAAMTPLVVLGALALAWVRGRHALLLLALPIYFLATYSPFLYEWRVAVPMHYTLCAAAAAAVLLAKAGVQALRTRRGSRYSDTTPALDG